MDDGFLNPLQQAFGRRFKATKRQEIPILEWLAQCRTDRLMYATAAERLLAAIGAPQLVRTSEDPQLARIYGNRIIRVYPTFSMFHDRERIIEQIVDFVRHGAQGLEESRQILYLLGPVGSGKSSLVVRLKELMAVHPMYVLKADDEISPVFESPLGLFDPAQVGAELEGTYSIPQRYLGKPMSPWATKHLDRFDGDFSRFSVERIALSESRFEGIVKVEPGEDEAGSVGRLIGAPRNSRSGSLRDQNDPEGYDYSGGLNRATQGLLEVVEIFKAPPQMLHPLLTATTDGGYAGRGGIGVLPFGGLIVVHSNQEEWNDFRGKKNNAALLDRIYLVNVPYSLRVSEEARIYKKLLRGSGLAEAPCAAMTLEMLAAFSILTRFNPGDNGNLIAKLHAYDGEAVPGAKEATSAATYAKEAGSNEGMEGVSTRVAYKVLAAAFNLDVEDLSADPVLLFEVLDRNIKRMKLTEDVEKRYLGIITGILVPVYREHLRRVLEHAFVEGYDNYAQNQFDYYVALLEALEDSGTFKDPDTSTVKDREWIVARLREIEKKAGIPNETEFRQKIARFSARYRAEHGNVGPTWSKHEAYAPMLERLMEISFEDLAKVIAFESRGEVKEEEKHLAFVGRMEREGYTTRQVRRLVEWYLTNK